MLRRVSPLKCLAGIVSVRNIPRAIPTATKHIVIEELKNRDIIKVRGEEAAPFLQGLITNDMRQLVNGRVSGHGYPSIYAMFLNKGGKMLYETVIYRTRDPFTFLIECDKNISHELSRHLQIYRVRRTVDIESMDKTLKPWIVFDPEAIGGGSFTAKKLGDESIYTIDPRVRGLGWRLLTAADRSFGDVARAFAVPGEVGVVAPTKYNNYRYNRYRYGIGEGVEDFPPGKCLPLELNGDFLNAVSFDKGSFIGQELTTRIHNTGATRKRLMPLRLTSISSRADAVQADQFGNVGSLRGVCNDRAIALLRVDHVIKASKLTINGDTCFADKPKWWPTELNVETCDSIADRV